MTSAQFIHILRQEYNVFMSPYGGENGSIRLRTHYWIDQQAIDKVLEAVRTILT